MIGILRFAHLFASGTGLIATFAFADECQAIRAVTVSAQRDFVAHIIGEDPKHTERVDGEAVYHLARSPMPDLLRCDVAAPVQPPALECIPAESNLIPSVARSRTKSALVKISECVREPIVGPQRVPGSKGLQQWFVTDWRERWPTRYRVLWSSSLSEPAWRMDVTPVVSDSIDEVGRATRSQKSKDRSAGGHACKQMFAIVAAAQNDFRSTLGRFSEKGSDMSLYVSSLRLMDFDVKVGVGGGSPNMLFAERVVRSSMTLSEAERMGEAASRAVSSCLQVRAERIADKIYPDGNVELIWRLADHYAARPVLVFTVVRYEPKRATVSRTAIRIERDAGSIQRNGRAQ
ncbi:hypothetical protein AWB74_08191 [Caballeronia arvi]|uniref:Uncharacterized protein n=1 Tax=Caballeronia arvi TaxID=1777135 RepID=A0A158L2L6_9BURK|nr:hypothetical protein [Caballeronia arvi]SAL87624.1 hypothetical protein AWB74_08191 [Caballeronia arvi]